MTDYLETRPTRSFGTAVKWAFVMNWGHKGIGAILTMVLAAILGPTAFGTVAMAMVYIAFLEMFLEQGLNAALIQRKDLQSEHLDTTFWMVLGVGLLLTGISLALSAWWASVNNLSALAPLINVLSLLIPVQCLTVVQQAILQREMDFKALAVRSNASVLVGGAVGIVMALAGYGVWALVGQKVSEAVVALILLWSLSHWRPRFRFSGRHMKDLLGFSIAIFIAKLGLFAGTRAYVLIAGLFFGPTAVGLYWLAARLLDTLLTVATKPFQVVSLPYYSSIQDDREALRRILLKTIHISAILTIPAIGLLAALSAPLMAVMGPQWVPAAEIVKLLCLATVFQIFGLYIGPLLQATGRPVTLMVVAWVNAVCGAVCILCVGLWLGNAPLPAQLMGLAGAQLVVTLVVNVPIILFYMKRLCRVSAVDLIMASGTATLSAILAGTVAVILSRRVLHQLPPVIVLAAAGIIAGTAAIMSLFLFDPEFRCRFSHVVLRLRQLLQGRREVQQTRSVASPVCDARGGASPLQTGTTAATDAFVSERRKDSSESPYPGTVLGPRTGLSHRDG